MEKDGTGPKSVNLLLHSLVMMKKPDCRRKRQTLFSS